MKFVLASHNKGKLAELQEILGELGVEVVLQSDVGLDLEPDETGTTFAENAKIKAQAVMEASGLPAIADDSGLCVDALQGAPRGVQRPLRRAGHDPAGEEPDAPAHHAGSVPPYLPLRLPHHLLLPQRGSAGRQRAFAAAPSPLRPWGTGASASTPSSSCPS